MSLKLLPVVASCLLRPSSFPGHGAVVDLDIGSRVPTPPRGKFYCASPPFATGDSELYVALTKYLNLSCDYQRLCILAGNIKPGLYYDLDADTTCSLPKKFTYCFKPGKLQLLVTTDSLELYSTIADYPGQAVGDSALVALIERASKLPPGYYLFISPNAVEILAEPMTATYSSPAARIATTDPRTFVLLARLINLPLGDMFPALAALTRQVSVTASPMPEYLNLDTLTQTKEASGYICAHPRFYSKDFALFTCLCSFLDVKPLKKTEEPIFARALQHKRRAYLVLETGEVIAKASLPLSMFKDEHWRIASLNRGLLRRVCRRLQDVEGPVSAASTKSASGSKKPISSGSKRKIDSMDIEESVVKKTRREPKKQIPKRIRDMVWRKHFNRLEGRCFCCRAPIRIEEWHCGHVVPECKKGATTVENLRPICGACNLSMGSRDMREFVKTHKLPGMKQLCK